MPANLVFSQDILLNIKVRADWETTMIRKYKQVDTNTVKQNSHRVDHNYTVGKIILITDKDIHRK